MRRSIAAAALLTALALGGFPPAVASAQPAPDVAACADGSCTVTVSGPVEIPLDGTAGPTALGVTDVGAYAVTFLVRSGSGRSYAMTGPGGTVRFTTGQGTLTVRVLELAGGTATIELGRA